MSLETATGQQQYCEAFPFSGGDEILTPALLIDRGRVEQNIRTTLALLAGDANRWRPHVKTAKLEHVMRMFAGFGVRHFKCATTLELKTVCDAGAEDVLVAYPVVGANARRVGEIARDRADVRISVLVESEFQIEQWRGNRVGLFVDVNPGMNRTGMRDENVKDLVQLCKSIISSGLELRGLHYYDGHVSDPDLETRYAVAHRGYRRLLHIVDELTKADIQIGEVITSGTPAFPCSLTFEGFSGAQFVHRISPGTIVYGDMTSLSQLPSEYGYVPAVVVLSRVVSHPAPGIITCDAGHKTVSADAGIPTCVVLGHPEFTPLGPSEEHLPIKIPVGGEVPSVGDFLYLLPRHVCPTVNNFDHAVIVSDGNPILVEAVSARGRERPMQV